MWYYDPSKALDYDGFNVKFIKKMWQIIGGEIFSFVQDFFSLSDSLSKKNEYNFVLLGKR